MPEYKIRSTIPDLVALGDQRDALLPHLLPDVFVLYTVRPGGKEEVTLLVEADDPEAALAIVGDRLPAAFHAAGLSAPESFLLDLIG